MTCEEHPRARGENARTRGRSESRSRNIPAHAGKTPPVVGLAHWEAEHPRARGENSWSKSLSQLPVGTSPRTRGKRLLTCGSSFLKVILHSVLFSRTMGV